MTKVGKSDGEGTFAGTRGSDGVAPIAVVRQVAIEARGSTLIAIPGHASGSSGSTRSSHSRRISAMLTTGPSQLIEKRLCVFEIARVEAFGEPAVNGCEQIAPLGPAPLFAPQPREARRGAQFIGFCLLPSRDPQRRFEGASGFLEPVETEERDPLNAMKFSVP